MSSYTYSAVVKHVVDGDTVDLEVSLRDKMIDLGFRQFVHDRNTMRDRFRLLGIDTPERGQPGWAEATEALRGMLPVGQQITITTTKPRDKYGRWLATIYVGELNVNQAMIDAGHAVVYR